MEKKRVTLAGDVKDAWQCDCLVDNYRDYVDYACEQCGKNAPHAVYTCVCGKRQVITEQKCYGCLVPNPNWLHPKKRSELGEMQHAEILRLKNLHTPEQIAAIMRERALGANTQRWMELKCGVNLSTFHKHIFENENMLDDTIMLAAAKVLRVQFQLHTSALQATIIQNKARIPISAFGIQFHHMVRPMLHWVVSVRQPCSFFCRVHDSVNTHNVWSSPEVVRDLHNVYGSTNVEVISNQRQPPGTVLCGDYAIAMAVDVLGGHQTDIPYDSSQMRQWLLGCLRSNEFLPCPRRVL